jgi:DNA repair photolyase
VFGLDLTAGCLHDCPFCYIQGSARYPGPERVLFDRSASEHLQAALDDLEMRPIQVVLSPMSDPLPADRSVRAAAEAAIDLLLKRGIRVALLTRGRISRALVRRIAKSASLVQVAMAFTTWERALSRLLEPGAATIRGRIRAVGRLLAAGVQVDVRLEPLIPGLNDTPEQVEPLFAAFAEAGIKRVLAHYLFIEPSFVDRLSKTLAPVGWEERLFQLYEGGPVFRIGSLGATKHLPLDTRRAGFAQLSVLGADHGLVVETGSTQNPDLRRAGDVDPSTGSEAPRRRPIPVTEER